MENVRQYISGVAMILTGSREQLLEPEKHDLKPDIERLHKIEGKLELAHQLLKVIYVSYKEMLLATDLPVTVHPDYLLFTLVDTYKLSYSETEITLYEHEFGGANLIDEIDFTKLINETP